MEEDLRALAQHPFSYTRVLDVEGHRVRVELELEIFYPRNHDVEDRRGIIYVDRSKPIGTDNSPSIAREFSRFSISWDGKAVTIPKKLYADLFNASLIEKKYPEDLNGSVWASASSDGRAVLIEFYGGEAAGAYKAWVVVHRDNHAVRFVENVTP